jgi:hypothetical protein
MAFSYKTFSSKDNIRQQQFNENLNAGKLMQRLSTFVRGNNSSGLMNIYKQLRALFACVVCSSLP